MKINTFVTQKLASLRKFTARALFPASAICHLPSAIRKQSSARIAIPAVFLAAGVALVIILLLHARATDLQITGVSGTTNRQANFLLTASPDEFWELQSNPSLSNGGWRTEKLVRGGDPAAFQAPATSNQMFFRVRLWGANDGSNAGISI